MQACDFGLRNFFVKKLLPLKFDKTMEKEQVDLEPYPDEV
jgi:hypothetical protein